jgi:hypothetical protein
MKNLFLGLALMLLLVIPALGQLSSSECLEEIKAVYARIDAEKLMTASEQVEIQYRHQFIMRKDETGKTQTQRETRVYGKGIYLLETPEFQTCSDAQEAFHYRKFQFTVYRTKPNREDAAFIPGVDKGLWAYATVTACEFIPIKGNDTLRHKQARVVINAEGQKKYAVSDIDLVWNPLNGQLVAIGLNFTEPSLYRWARFDFESFAVPKEALPTDAKSVLLDGTGKLKETFGGAELLDYR